MAPAIDFNQTLTPNSAVSTSLCQFLPSVLTLVYLCANHSDFVNPAAASDDSRAAAWLQEASWPQQPNLDGDLLDAEDAHRQGNQTDADGVSMVEMSTDRGPPPPDLDAENCTAVAGAEDERPPPMDGVPCNETEEERKFRLHNERVNHVNMVKAYVLIGVVVIILLTCFKVVFQLFITYSNDQADKNDR